MRVCSHVGRDPPGKDHATIVYAPAGATLSTCMTAGLSLTTSWRNLSVLAYNFEHLGREIPCRNMERTMRSCPKPKNQKTE